MITNHDDAKQYRNELDEQFDLDPNYEYSFYYLCGEYVPYPAVCYIRKEYFDYMVQFVPIDRSITYEPEEWTVLDDIGKFIWNNRFNIHFSELPHNELIT